MMMMIKTNFSGPFLLLTILSSASLGSVVRKHYSYNPWNYKTWHEARDYCRSLGSYTDLAIMYSDQDKYNMVVKFYRAWTSLHKEGFHWMWSDGHEHNPSWASENPGNHPCAYAYENKRMYGSSCSSCIASFCQEGNNYIFINEGKMWFEAQEYCRNVYDDLATFEDSNDVDNAVRSQDYPIWIGLHRDGGIWKWSSGMSEYRSWASNEPDDNDDCVSISSESKEMYTNNCTVRFPFFCFSDNLLLLKENLTWEEALLRCRSHSYELLSVQPGLEHIYVITRLMEAETEEVWTGLHFLAGRWMWINKANILYPDLPPCPEHSQSCGALSKNNTGSIELRDCTERKNAICYK